MLRIRQAIEAEQYADFCEKFYQRYRSDS